MIMFLRVIKIVLLLYGVSNINLLYILVYLILIWYT